MIESPHPEGNAIEMDRLEQLRIWAGARLQCPLDSIVPASADASFRRYFRITWAGRSLIAMDAPPAHEDCRPFVHVARLFRDAGVNVPEIVAEDLSQGFLLLTDFGATTYLDAIAGGDAQALYLDALDALIRIQCASRAAVLPEYDRALLAREVALFPQWYVAKHLGRGFDARAAEVFDGVVDRLIAHNLTEPRVYVHRDYHARNLMLTTPNPGILDFQDAVYGPISYDLVSLLKDAYVEWHEARILDWAIRYWERARRAGLPVCDDFARFYRDFEWMGVQRHLKVLGIFARLHHRDGKARYLADMPLVLRHLVRTCERYGELAPLARLLDELHARAPRIGHTF